MGYTPVGPAFVSGNAARRRLFHFFLGQPDFARYIVLHVSPPSINIVAHDSQDDPEHFRLSGNSHDCPPLTFCFAIRFGVPLKRLIRLESISKQIENAAKLIVHILGENGLCLRERGLIACCLRRASQPKSEATMEQLQIGCIS